MKAVQASLLPVILFGCSSSYCSRSAFVSRHGQQKHHHRQVVLQHVLSQQQQQQQQCMYDLKNPPITTKATAARRTTTILWGSDEKNSIEHSVEQEVEEEVVQAETETETEPEPEPELELETKTETEMDRIATKLEEETVLDIEQDKETDDADDYQKQRDILHMQTAIQLAKSFGGERGEGSPFPNPIGGAVLVDKDGNVMGEGRCDYKMDCIRAAIEAAGIEATPLHEWCVNFPSSKLREAISTATLYVTLEPVEYGVRESSSIDADGSHHHLHHSTNREHKYHGQESIPPITQLIELTGIPRVVIGCPHPAPEYAMKGASTLHRAGIEVTCGKICEEECRQLLPGYSRLVNSKLQRIARKHFQQFGRPLGFLHCSVVDSVDRDAFARHGNAFGKDFGGKTLSFRDFGSYEIAPPPEVVWASDDYVISSSIDEEEDEDLDNEEDDDIETEIDDFFASLDFEDEDYQGGVTTNPMTPWYEQMDAVVATFPREGNGPANDNSLAARLKGLKWLATQGNELPAAVERVLVMDATDLKDLPLYNSDWKKQNLPDDVDIEQFWRGSNRKPTRVLLRRGESVQAKATAKAVAAAAECAAQAAKDCCEAIETGDAIKAAEAAIEYQQAAIESTKLIQEQLEQYQSLKRKLTSEYGVIVETIKGGEPIDVMKHLGERNGYHAVVWRAGCWGERGVKSILAGAFQFVSAHLAVDAKGGQFWQQMLAENAVQAACGPQKRVKIFADEDDLSLEYCDQADDEDCVLTVDGRPIRHVRLDCRIAVLDEDRPREVQPVRTRQLDQKFLVEEAPWFL